MKTLRFGFEVAAFRVLLWVAHVVPRRIMLGLGAVVGSVGRIVDRRHATIALDNLELALGPDLPRQEARRIVRECWRHFGRITFDTLYFKTFDLGAIGRLVHYEGLEHIRAAYERGKGVLLFSGHFGHWELTALMQGHLGLRLSLVTRPLDNPRLERLLAELRGHSGNRIVHKRNAVREMLRALREREGVAIVLDQDARNGGVFVPFFGRMASTTPTLALLALRSDATVIPTYSVPLPDGSYKIVYEPPIEIRPTGNHDEDLRRITADCTAAIERWVREHPELWLWMHRRWKTVPSPAETRAESSTHPRSGG